MYTRMLGSTIYFLYCFALLLATNFFFLDAASIAVPKECYIIKQAQTADFDIVIALDTNVTYEYLKEVLRQYPEFISNERALEECIVEMLIQHKDWVARCALVQNQYSFYIAYDGTTPIGFVGAHQDGTSLIIDLLMIDKKFRGKGIGKQLIQRCIQSFPTASECLLIVLDKNEQARSVYEKMGFVLMAEKPAYAVKHFPQPWLLCYQLSPESPLFRLSHHVVPSAVACKA